MPAAPSTDIDGQYRPQRGAPDIGADEFYDAVALDNLNVACPPSSNGLTAIDAQASPANASRPVSYTVSTADELPRLYTGWTSATLDVGWALPGVKTVIITATNPHGSIARNCVVNVSAPARAVWMPVLNQ